MNATDLLRHWFFLMPYAGNWNYENEHLWKHTYPECGGYRQSPIDLSSYNSYLRNSMELQFHNYRKPLSPPVEMINNGHTAEIGVRINNDESIPFLTFGGYKQWYEIQAIHFHWGSDGVLGSEHTINGQQYDLEMHIVHKNNKYETIEEARANPDGLVALGVLFQSVPVKLQQKGSHRTLNKVYKSLKSISKYNSTTELRGPITMSSFLPGVDPTEYFVYKGSLTTPPCSESVLWIVFTDIIPISYDDIEKFWTLFDSNGSLMLNTFRPTQPSNLPVYQKRNAHYYWF